MPGILRGEILGLDRAALWVSSAALVVSIIAMGAQIVQWDREGAVFDVKALYEATGLSTFDGTRKLFSQQGQAVIVTNTDAPRAPFSTFPAKPTTEPEWKCAYPMSTRTAPSPRPNRKRP